MATSRTSSGALVKWRKGNRGKPRADLCIHCALSPLAVRSESAVHMCFEDSLYSSLAPIIHCYPPVAWCCVLQWKRVDVMVGTKWWHVYVNRFAIAQQGMVSFPYEQGSRRGCGRCAHRGMYRQGDRSVWVYIRWRLMLAQLTFVLPTRSLNMVARALERRICKYALLYSERTSSVDDNHLVGASAWTID